MKAKFLLNFLGFFVIACISLFYTYWTLKQNEIDNARIKIITSQHILTEKVVKESILYQIHHNKESLENTIKEFDTNLQYLNEGGKVTNINEMTSIILSPVQYFNIVQNLNEIQNLWSSLKEKTKSSINKNVLKSIQANSNELITKLSATELYFQKEVNKKFWYLKIWFAASLFITIVWGLIGWWLEKKYLIKPIEYISLVLSQVTAGQYDLRIDYKAKDELGYVVSQLNYMLDALQNVNAQRLEAMEQLAGVVAHEFNNLLTVINGYTDLIDITPESKSFQYLQEIRKSTSKAVALVQQLLVFSRGIPFKMETVSLNSIITDIKPMLRRLIGKQIGLQTILTSQNDTINVDYIKIEHVIIDLVINARESMPHGGELTLETKIVEIKTEYYGIKPDHYVVISISDNGEKFFSGAQTRMFEPFSVTKELGQEVALNFIAIYGIVKKHGGYILYHTQEGKGNTFSIYFPDTAEQKAGIRVKMQELAAGETNKGTILIVEDDESVLRIAQLTLTNFGYRVITAKNGDDAFNLLTKATSVDLMISDIVMPGMSGMELVERIRLLRPGLKIILMSGYTEQDFSQNDIIDSIPFLGKPFTPMSLLNSVEEVLKKG